MAGIEISALPAVVTALGTDFFPVVQGGVTKRETADQLVSKNNSIIGMASTTSSSVGVFQQNGVPLLNTYQNNLFLGGSAGNFSMNIVAQRNIGIGLSALNVLTTGTDNCIVAYNGGSTLTTGVQNAMFGANPFITTGSYNSIFGVNSGGNYTGAESSNILIGNAGVLGESHICRIGTTGSGAQQVTDTYLAGNVHGTMIDYLPLAGGDLTGAVTNTGQYLFKPATLVTTMSQTGILATISGVSSAQAGGFVIPAAGTPFTIVSYQGTTTVPTNVSQTIAGGTACTVYYFTANPLDSTINTGIMNLFSGTRYLYLGSSPFTFLKLSNGTAQTFTSTASAPTAPNNSANQTASQSGTTVTGVGTSWNSTYIGHMIRFATGETGWITAVGSTTSMTVTPSQTVASTDFDIPGKTTASEATSMDALGNFGSNNIYANNSLNSIGLTTLSGGRVNAVTSVTGATYTALTTDYVLACNRAGTIAITLISSPATGRTYRIKDVSGAAATNNITITPASGNIDGAASFVINTNYGSVDITYTGSEWSVL